MANIFKKAQVCSTCNGEKTIECCSCGVEDNECFHIECPTCHGTGEIMTYNAPVILATVLGAMVGAVLVFLISFY